MTYIQWRDAMAAGLGELPRGEREKILRACADEYAALRRQGLDEEQCISRMGDPKKAAKAAIKARQGAYTPAVHTQSRADDCLATRLLFTLGGIAALIGMAVAIIWLICIPAGLITGGLCTLVGGLIAHSVAANHIGAHITMIVGGCLAAGGLIALPICVMLIKVVAAAFGSLCAWLGQYAGRRARV